MDSSRPAVIRRKTEIVCDSAAFAELGAAILAQGKSLRFRARGYSMHPLVRDGDLLTVEPVDVRSLRRGDLVFFRNPRGKMVVHRMIRRFVRSGAVNFQMKGDGLPGSDEPVPGTQVLGRVSSIERNGVCIDVRQPGMQLLGLSVAILGPGRIRTIPWLKTLIQKAPVFARYLA